MMNVEYAEVYFKRNGFIFTVDRSQSMFEETYNITDIMTVVVCKWDDFKKAKDYVLENVNRRYFCNLTEAKRLGFS